MSAKLAPYFQNFDVTVRTLRLFPKKNFRVSSCARMLVHKGGELWLRCLLYLVHQTNEQFRWKRKARTRGVDRGCIFTCAGGDVDIGLCERCYEKIGIDTGWWYLVGLAERPVSSDTSIFLWEKKSTHTAQLLITILSYSSYYSVTRYSLTIEKKTKNKIRRLMILKYFSLLSIMYVSLQSTFCTM